MVYHLILCRLKTEVTPAEVEAMMRGTRAHLLKISEVKSLRCGQGVPPESAGAFFVAMEFESLDRLAQFRANAQAHAWQREHIDPHVASVSEWDYELEPGKDPKFS